MACSGSKFCTPVQLKSVAMHASFRGRKGGVDWDKKKLPNVVTEFQLEAPQYSHESTLYMNQTGQVRASMAVLIQLFVVLTGLNKHNTGGSPCSSSTSQIPL